MQKMTPSPASSGTIGPLWCRGRELVTCARLRIRETFAAAAARAGAKMSEKFNTRFTKILKLHDEWLRAQGYKPSSNRTQEARPQAKGSSFRKSPSSRIREPGYKRTSWSRAQATRTKVFFLCLMWKDIWCGENRTNWAFLGEVDFNSTVKKVPREE